MAEQFAVKSVSAFTVPVSEKTTWIFIEIAMENGPSGWGEATLAGAESAVLVEVADAHLLLAGKALRGPGEAVTALRVARPSQARLTVQRAIEQAMLDAAARRANVPLATMLGGPERTTIPVYANINRGIPTRSPEGFADRARAVVTEEGYRAIKIAPFDGLHWSKVDDATARQLLGEGLDRIAAVRAAIGPDVALMVDCHSRLSPVSARTVLREVENVGLFWLEEPLDEDVFDAHTARALRSAANDRGVRIAGGENLTTLTDAREFLARGICDAVLPDLRWIGIRTGMAMLELAASSGVAVSIHNPVGPVLDQISVQVAAALPSFLILERQVRESPLFDEVRGAPPNLSNGELLLDDAPGIGREPDRDVLEQCRTRAFKRSTSPAAIVEWGRTPDEAFATLKRSVHVDIRSDLRVRAQHRQSRHKGRGTCCNGALIIH